MPSKKQAIGGGAVLLGAFFLWLLSRKDGRTFPGGSGSTYDASDVPHDVGRWYDLAVSLSSGWCTPDVILTLIWKESNGDPQQVGPVQERGLMQLWKPTADGLGVDWDKMFNPTDNIAAGCRVFNDCIDASAAQASNGIPSLHGGFQCYNAGADDIGDPVKGKAYADDAILRLPAVIEYINREFF